MPRPVGIHEPSGRHSVPPTLNKGNAGTAVRGRCAKSRPPGRAGAARKNRLCRSQVLRDSLGPPDVSLPGEKLRAVSQRAEWRVPCRSQCLSGAATALIVKTTRGLEVSILDFLVE